MNHVLLALNPLHVIVVAIIGFVLGGLWYSPIVFAKTWMREMKFTEESMKAAGGAAGKLVATLLLTVVSTTVLAAVVADHGSLGLVHGGELGLMLGAGLVVTREAINGIFQRSSLCLFLIVAGHDLILFGLQGALLGRWH